jgi:hypothetical protein
MKRTYLKKIGKQGTINLEANKEIHKMFRNKGIVRCEAWFPKCLVDWTLQFAHRHKRIWYKKCPEKLYDFNEVILACQNCHTKLENNKELTEETFKKLRS